jgi:hypothetical protein
MPFNLPAAERGELPPELSRFGSSATTRAGDAPCLRLLALSGDGERRPSATPVRYVNSSAVRKCPFAARSYLRTPFRVGSALKRRPRPQPPESAAGAGPRPSEGRGREHHSDRRPYQQPLTVVDSFCPEATNAYAAAVGFRAETRSTMPSFERSSRSTSNPSARRWPSGSRRRWSAANRTARGSSSR